MKESKILKVLSSIPVILISLYFIPFLGICLIILRYLIVDNKKRISTPIYIIGVGILILIPKGLNLILNMVKVDLAIIPSLKDAINAELYNVNFINYLLYLQNYYLIQKNHNIFSKTINNFN